MKEEEDNDEEKKEERNERRKFTSIKINCKYVYNLLF